MEHSGRSNLFVNKDDLRFKHPFNLIVGGASGSGKTEWVCKFLDEYENLITPAVQRILYCYGVYNSNVLRMERSGIETYLGLPTEKMIRENPGATLLVLDDLMLDAKSDFLDLLFTRGSHHWGVSIIFITQNMFEKTMKTARNNAHYLVLLRNPAGQLQIRNLGTQLFPRKLGYFLDAYTSATANNYGYLLVDIHPSSPELTRLRTGIFESDDHVIYVPK